MNRENTERSLASGYEERRIQEAVRLTKLLIGSLKNPVVYDLLSADVKSTIFSLEAALLLKNKVTEEKKFYDKRIVFEELVPDTNYITLSTHKAPFLWGFVGVDDYEKKTIKVVKQVSSYDIIEVRNAFDYGLCEHSKGFWHPDCWTITYKSYTDGIEAEYDGEEFAANADWAINSVEEFEQLKEAGLL